MAPEEDPRARAALLVRRGDDGPLEPLSRRLSDGGKVVLVFGEPSAAEAFRILEGLGEDWRTGEPPPKRSPTS